MPDQLGVDVPAVNTYPGVPFAILVTATELTVVFNCPFVS
jgi:hypothetical protein